MKRRWIILSALPISLGCLFLNEIECFISACPPENTNSWFASWPTLLFGVLSLSLVTWVFVLPLVLMLRKWLAPHLVGFLVAPTCAVAFTAFLHFTQGPLSLANAVRYLFVPLLVGWVSFSWLAGRLWPNPSINTDAAR